jgi:N-acetylmuramoyl-L-alanine amidase
MRVITLGIYLCLAGDLFAASRGGASAVGSTLPQVELYGRQCVELPAWARRQGLAYSFSRETGQIVLSRKGIRLEFAVDSRRSVINGIVVWLSVPIIPNSQKTYIALLDLRSMIQPLLSPARGKNRIRTVVLDPGHGGKDPGLVIRRDVEKRHTLLLAQEVRNLLQEAGLKVVMTRKSDAYVDFPERTAIAKAARADLFISLHYNGAGTAGREVRGVETYCETPAGAQSTNVQGDPSITKYVPGNATDDQNILLAYQVQQALVRSLGMDDRGVRRARFAVLREATMPAVLVEGGFLTDPDEARGIRNQDHRQELAQAIVDGVLAYKRLVERR